MTSGVNLELALGYIRSLTFCDKVLIGIDSIEQLAKVVAASKAQIAHANFSEFASFDLNLIDPRNWGT